jgi:hypothetical protein
VLWKAFNRMVGRLPGGVGVQNCVVCRVLSGHVLHQDSCSPSHLSPTYPPHSPPPLWSCPVPPPPPCPPPQWVFKTWREYFSFSYLNEAVLDPQKKYIFVEFPHGEPGAGGGRVCVSAVCSGRGGGVGGAVGGTPRLRVHGAFAWGPCLRHRAMACCCSTAQPSFPSSHSPLSYASFHSMAHHAPCPPPPPPYAPPLPLSPLTTHQACSP